MYPHGVFAVVSDPSPLAENASSAVLAAVLSMLATATAASAGEIDGSGIQRCVDDDGAAIYTDKACATFSARPAPMSQDLHRRLALANAASNDESTANSVGFARGAFDADYRDASELLPLQVTTRRSPAAGCARTPMQLSANLVRAFAHGDVNLLAENYHWAGMSQRQALPVMNELERLSAQPLADARFLAAWIGSGDASLDAIPTDAGLMQLVFDGEGSRTVDVEVRRYADCYFISF